MVDNLVNPMENTLFDLAIIGSGPAGLSAAINATIRKKSILLFGSSEGSKKLISSPRIDNYAGFPRIAGKELYDKFLNHAQAMGIQPKEEKISQIAPEGSAFILTSQDHTYRARTVIITTGIFPAHLLPGEKELLGMGVSYCATCDGPLFSGKRVAFISHGREGEGEANFLSEICQEVYYIPLYPAVGPLAEKIKLLQDKPKAIKGEGGVSSLELEGQTIPLDGVFLYREAAPADTLAPGLEQDQNNHIKVNVDMETNLPGLFAAGDCVGRPYQVAKAVGQGLVAALNAVIYLDKKA